MLADCARGEETALRHARVALALLGAANVGLPRDPNGYVRRHLAEHVAASASWAALAEHPDVLDRLDPDSVAAGVLTHAFGREGVKLPAEIAAVASVRHLLGPLSPGDRKLTRTVAMARLGGDAPRHTGSTPKHQGEARVSWTALRPSPMQVALAGHTGSVISLAALTLADGRCLLASGGSDQTIRLWDPATGSAVGAPLTGHAGAVRSLAAFTLADGRCLLASGSDDKTIRLWDPATGSAVGPPLTGHTGWVQSLAAITLDDERRLLASGSSDQTVRLWEVQDCRTLHVWGLGFSIRALAWASNRLIVAGDAGVVAIEVE